MQLQFRPTLIPPLVLYGALNDMNSLTGSSRQSISIYFPIFENPVSKYHSQEASLHEFHLQEGGAYNIMN